MDVEEDKRAGTVTVDGFTVPGWISGRPCPKCGAGDVYHEELDAYFCPCCNVWLEENCGDPGCQYCAERPVRPLPDSAPGVGG